MFRLLVSALLSDKKPTFKRSTWHTRGVEFRLLLDGEKPHDVVQTLKRNIARALSASSSIDCVLGRVGYTVTPECPTTFLTARKAKHLFEGVHHREGYSLPQPLPQRGVGGTKARDLTVREQGLVKLHEKQDRQKGSTINVKPQL